MISPLVTKMIERRKSFQLKIRSNIILEMRMFLYMPDVYAAEKNENWAFH